MKSIEIQYIFYVLAFVSCVFGVAITGNMLFVFLLFIPIILMIFGDELFN